MTKIARKFSDEVTGAVGSEGGDVSEHYEAHTARSYENAFFYSDKEYTVWLRDLVRDAMVLDPADDTSGGSSGDSKRRLLVDIGGGTGNFTSELIDGVDSMDAVVIDPFLPASMPMSPSAPAGKIGKKNCVHFVRASAKEFISGADGGADEWWKIGYDRVLLKEVVHHLDSKLRVDIFTSLKDGLTFRKDAGDGGASLLIITRPQDIDYPLWPAARDVWAADQPSAEDIATDLHRAGFQNVRWSVKSYPCNMALGTWLDMVRNRCWSTFRTFSDEELAEGSAYITKEVCPDEEGQIEFEDKLVFLTASK